MLKTNLDTDVVLCTDSAFNYKLYAKKKAIRHKFLNGNKGERVKKGIYDIQHVNAYHQWLKTWIQRFNGVAIRYIDN
ncbi:hypothetical protein PAENI_28015 [Paenibacillus sp. B2(2019)]|nr:hypothetical protein PAENI_28015 [Paenibacillus sp. B2(2019)]